MAARLAVEAHVLNAALFGLFAVQYSAMGRPAFKRWWDRFVPASPGVRRTNGPAARSMALLSPPGEFVRAVIAEYHRATVAAHLYSDLRRMDAHTLARHGVTRAGIPRRVFDECFSLDCPGATFRHGHAATPPRMAQSVTAAKA